ncbi:MAG: NADH-quinone oxidoreductase subunit NuoE, partial [Chloroflexi bacterium]|nr:NADH-quinone oxidoreductase subunit NuoE [Chloroflexota bacterium]
SALMPALELAQRELGWLPNEALVEVGELLGVPSVEVLSVASFYTMYQRRPVGKYLLQVCGNVSCALLGAKEVLAAIERKLGIAVGETTADGLFTLLEVECLGACGSGPVMQVNDRYCENLTPEKVEQLLEELAAQG